MIEGGFLGVGVTQEVEDGVKRRVSVSFESLLDRKYGRTGVEGRHHGVYHQV